MEIDNDGYYQDVDEARDDYSRDSARCSRGRNRGEWFRKRKAQLSNSIEAPRNRNIQAKVGTECRCPICGKSFVKKSYQQRFCGGECRIKYNNKRMVYFQA